MIHTPLHSAQFRSGMGEFTVSLKTLKFTVKTWSYCQSVWLLNKRPVVSVMKTSAASSSDSDSTPPSSLPRTRPTQSSGAMNNLFTALCRFDNILERRQREITARMVLHVKNSCAHGEEKVVLCSFFRGPTSALRYDKHERHFVQVASPIIFLNDWRFETVWFNRFGLRYHVSCLLARWLLTAQLSSEMKSAGS